MIIIMLIRERCNDYGYDDNNNDDDYKNSSIDNYDKKLKIIK